MVYYIIEKQTPSYIHNKKNILKKVQTLVNSLGCPQEFDNKTVLLKTTHSLVIGLEETRRFIIFSALEDAT